MEITELKIFTNHFNEQEDFYKNVLGFKCSRLNNYTLEIQAGKTKMFLEKSTKKFYYHFAFLIPTGTLNSAINFLEMNCIELLTLKGNKIIKFSTARSIYFYDLDGNITEFIERPTLGYPLMNEFSIDLVIKVNEIGLPVSNPKKITQRLIDNFGIQPIKHALYSDRFCWVGDYEGAIIVIEKGRNWLPTQKQGILNDFSIKYTSEGKFYTLKIVGNEIQTLPNTT